MEATETVTRTVEATPTGTVETVETSVERDEGDITETWLNERFAENREMVLQRLSVLENQHQTILETLQQLKTLLPSNLTELLTNQQSMITSLTNQLAEMTKTLLIPQAQPVPEPIPVPEGNAEATLEPAVVVAPVEPARRKVRAV